ncbi:MAG: N-acetyl-gamma-glutamyl-phosphate reductase [Deltaproteobacteria bacterium]|nr:N-acetyl-gamma-glutamyl-phosphate reductase [Deltaproteobacteria bacterium]
MLKVAILGGSGYTGIELLRILSRHKSVKVEAVTSRQYKGRDVTEIFPSLRGFYDGLKFMEPADFSGIDAGFFFCAMPHGSSMEAVPGLLKNGNRVVDLSADFRIKQEKVYEEWYGAEHKAKGLLKDAVYGLPELYREKIKDAALVANPGCYPTGAILALAPLIKQGVIAAGSIVIDSKSGVSGAGRTPALETSFAEVTEGFRAYKVASHRHTPEMEEILGDICGKAVTVTFTPHLLPVERGILSTVYAGIKKPAKTPIKTPTKTNDLIESFSSFYRDEPFVRICPAGTLPNIRDVRGSNFCDIGLVKDERAGRVIAISAIDNLTKGASGQAVQNMNIMCGFNETEALDVPPL